MPLKIQALYAGAYWPYPLIWGYGRRSKINWEPVQPSHGPDVSAGQNPKAAGLLWQSCKHIFDSVMKGTVHCRIKSTQFTWITPLFSYCSSLSRSKPYTPSHLFPLRFARQHLAAGKNKNQCVFPPPHSSASCFTQHRAIRCQDEFSSSWPPPNKPRAIGLLYYRAVSAGAAIICLSVLWAGAQEPSLGSV